MAQADKRCCCCCPKADDVKEPVVMIGGEYCYDELDPQLIPQEQQELTQYERDRLWRLFQKIGLCWDDLYYKSTDSSNLRSSWLEFIEAKTKHEPTYIAEYSNAVHCVDELVEIYGEDTAYTLLFLANGIPEGPPITRLAHAKRYVVDEFIRVNIVASGFRSFGGENYKGYIGGSRYNLEPRVRAYRPESEDE